MFNKNKNTIKMQEDIDLFCWLVPELPPTGKRNSVQMSGGWWWGRVVVLVRLYVWISMKLVDASGWCTEIQTYAGILTDDKFSCLLVIYQKLSWGTFWECHVNGVTKCRINIMFRTNSKCNYFNQTRMTQSNLIC